MTERCKKKGKKNHSSITTDADNTGASRSFVSLGIRRSLSLMQPRPVILEGVGYHYFR